MAQDGHNPAADRHASGAAHHRAREHLQDNEQAGGRTSGQGAAAAAWQRLTPRQRDEGQQRAIF